MDNPQTLPTTSGESTTPSPVGLADTMSVIQNLENLIKNQSAQIEKLRSELKQHKSMLADYFQNDETYKSHEAKAKEATRIKTATKQQLLKAPQAMNIDSKLKDIQSTVKELEQSLSEYLREYHRLSGIDTITDDTGETKQIVYTAKLVKTAKSRGA